MAKQILERVSGEAKARRQATLLVERAYVRYADRGVLLTQEDLDEIRPHEAGIQFRPEEQAFINKSRTAIERADRRKRQIAIAIISVLSIFLLFALWQWQRSVASSKALRARALYEDGYTSQAFRMAQSAWKAIGIDKSTTNTIEEVLGDIAASGLERDLLHEATVQSFDIDADEQYLLSIMQGTDAWLWDLRQRKKLFKLSHSTALAGGLLLPPKNDQQVILTTWTDRTAHFWNKEGELHFQQPLQQPIQAVDFSASLDLCLLWSTNELLILKDSNNIWPADLVPEQILNADISPNGDYLLIATRDSLQSWWLRPFTLGASIKPEFTMSKRIRSAEYVDADASNIKILVSFEDGTREIYDYNGELASSSNYHYFKSEMAQLTFNDKTFSNQFEYSPPGHEHPKILFRTDSVSIYYWSAYRFDLNKKPVGTMDFYTRYDEPVLATRFSQEEGSLLTASADGRVDIWDIAGSSIKRARRWRALIRQARFIQQDKMLVTTAQDRTIKIWRLDGGPERAVKDILNNYDDRLQVFR